jgi:methionyl-tRNA formyltransferase
MIYQKICDLGVQGIKEIIYNKDRNYELKYIQQEGKGSYYKRRNPSQSEIIESDFSNFTAEELFNKIVGLQDPYPNAFIKCKDGTKLYITNAKYE